MGIVDVYAALTSDRPYRKAASREEAIATLRAQGREGCHYPELVEKFIECVTGDAGRAVPESSPTPELAAASTDE